MYAKSPLERLSDHESNYESSTRGLAPPRSDWSEFSDWIFRLTFPVVAERQILHRRKAQSLRDGIEMRTQRLVLFIAIAWTLAGCDRAQEVEADSPQEVVETAGASAQAEVAPFPRNDWECTEESRDNLESWWEAWSWEASIKVDVGAISLPVGEPDQAVYPSDGPLVLVDQESLSVNGDEVNLSDLEATLAAISEVDRAAREIMGESADGAGESVTLAIDAQTPVERVGEVVNHLRAGGVSNVVLVVGVESVGAGYERVPAEVVERLERIFGDADDPRAAVMAETQEATQGCPEIRALFDGLERMPPERRSAALGEHLPARWYDCDCEADIEWILGLYAWRTLDAGSPARFVARTIDELEAELTDARATWEDVVVAF